MINVVNVIVGGAARRTNERLSSHQVELTWCDGYRVSTVRLPGPTPDGTRYETLVFVGHRFIEVDEHRYGTLKDAIKGHWRLVGELAAAHPSATIRSG